MKKLISFLAASTVLLNSVLAPVSVLAQETTPTPEATTAPTEQPTVTPDATTSEIATPTPIETMDPEATPSPTPTATISPNNVVNKINEFAATTPQPFRWILTHKKITIGILFLGAAAYLFLRGKSRNK